jgi:hypothetical protein
MACSCEHGKEPSYLTQGMEFVGQLGHYSLLN